MKPKVKIFLFLFFLVTIYLVWRVFSEKISDFIYADFGEKLPEKYPVLGMDISHYQGEINWDQVEEMRIDNDSISFVFIKATEGLNLEDDRKRPNAYGARGADIAYGFYHFFIPSQSARGQAEFFCEEIGGYNFDLKPVLDVEPDDNINASQLKDSIKVFLNFVEKRLNTRPIVYTYSNLYQEHLSSLDELFWVAKYAQNCPAMEAEKVICWQFSETGTVDGIKDNVDLNVAKENFFSKFSR
jgi:lysozyme